MSGQEDKISGIRNPVENGVQVVTDNIYDAANIKTYDVSTPNLPVLSRSYELYFSWKRLLKGIDSDYSQIILPSYTRMVNVNPRKYTAEIIPFVFQLHKVSYDPGTIIGKVNVRLASRQLDRCNRVLVCSSGTKSQLMEHTSLREKQIGIIRPGIDTEEFFPETEEPETMDLPENYILYVGTFVDRKNTQFLVDVLEKLPEDVWLVMAGDCYNKDSRMEFMQYAESNGQRDRIQHVGYISDTSELRRLYSNAEVYIHPSKFEGYGMAPVEAAACGTSPVLFRELPVADDVQDKGELFDEFDAAVVAEKCEQVFGETINYTPRTWEQSVQTLFSFLK
jgi:glycosyltransferase involved in cell wall biosynthesis